MATTRRALAFVVFLLALAGSSSLATVPGQISYQGLLLDDQGAPVNGMVDLVFTLFDAATEGTQLWTESHDDVSVLDGVYDVVLGETTPIAPTVVAGGALYLEIEVDTETLTPRQRLVAVPYAIEAENAGNLGGFASAWFTEVVENFNFDGGPPNEDPSEGLGDTDNDGIANFVDPDNDDDGLSDTQEVAAGSDINLVTPTISGFSAAPAEASTTFPVTVLGTNFQAGLMVVFGSQSPVPSNITPTSFDVMVGPQPPGIVTVTVTLPNAEQASDNTFEFIEYTPMIAGFQPTFADSGATTVVTISGTDFFPGLQVTFGSESPTPTNLSQTSFDVSVGPQTAGVVNVVLSYPSGNQDSASYEFVSFTGASRIFVTSQGYDGNLGGLAGADAKCQAAAAAASLTGTYLAWLSDGVSDPAGRFNILGAAPYLLVDDTFVALDWPDLTDGTLDAAISLDENGSSVITNVWSNVAADGTHASTNPNASCNGWISNQPPTSGFTGDTGSSIATDSSWTNSVSLSCAGTRPLYCVRQ